MFGRSPVKGRSPLTPASGNGAETQSGVTSGDSGKSRTEEVSESFRRLSVEALQLNARSWLASLVASPLPADVPFETLVRNGALLARVTASLVAATRAGTSDVTPAVLSEEDLGLVHTPKGLGARVKAAQDNASAFVTHCRSLGCRNAELCTTGDVLNPVGQGARGVCVALYAVSLRAKALGLRVPPFPVADLTLPREQTQLQAARFNQEGPVPSAGSATRGGGSSGWNAQPRGLVTPVTPSGDAERSVVGDSRTPMSAGLTEPMDGQHPTPFAAPAGGGDAPTEAVGDSDVLLPPLVTPAGTPVRMSPLPPKTGDGVGTPASGGWGAHGGSDGASPLWSPSATQTLYIAAAAAAGAAVVATAYFALNAASHRPGRTRWRSREGDVAVAGSLVLWRTVDRRT